MKKKICIITSSFPSSVNEAKSAGVFVHPTKFTGEWPDWNGFTFLDWHKSNNVFHPAEDYNLGYGDQDLGQDVVTTASGIVIHTSKRTTGYGNIVINKHTLGYNLKRFIKETYGIETDTLFSFYAHLKDIFVNVGDFVEVGQRIGTVGRSGTKSPHLHFEIYAPIGELAKKGWRFYPTGWAKETIKKYWLPAYRFIESTKNLESYETFLGKSKEYWLTVEKDRIDLMRQLGEKDKEWAIKVENAEKPIKQLEEVIAKMITDVEKAEISHKKEVKKLTKKFEKLEGSASQLKEENTELLKETAKNLSFVSALKIVFNTISQKIEEVIMHAKN